MKLEKRSVEGLKKYIRDKLDDFNPYDDSIDVRVY